MTTTIFTRIIAGELPCAKVYEDELTWPRKEPGLDKLKELAAMIRL
ncbi:MAG: hypothetical protein U1A72_16345 [Sulfuritalea sp.]|nr:hypothetical protein [Sulfuritalea sp.]